MLGPHGLSDTASHTTLFTTSGSQASDRETRGFEERETTSSLLLLPGPL